MTGRVATLRRLWRLMIALAFSAMACAVPVSGKPQTTPLPQGDGFIQPFGQTRYLIDPQGRMDLAQVLNASDRFKPIERRWIDFGNRGGRIWFTTRIANTGERDGMWMLDLQRQWADSLDVWKVGTDGTRTRLLTLTGQSTLADRPVRNRYIAVPLDMAAGEIADVVIGHSGSTGSWLPLTFATQEAYRNAHQREERTNWAINGALAALIAMALALGRIATWRLVLSYCVYALTGGLLVANAEGYLFEFVWPDRPGWYQSANLALVLALIAAGLACSRNFTRLGERRPGMDRWLRGFMALVVAAIPLAVFTPHATLTHVAVYCAVAIGAAVYLAIAAEAVRARILGALPFAIGAVVLASTLGFAGLVLAFPGQYAVSVVLDYVHATLLIEGIAFLIAIVLRIISIRDERNRAVAAELEASQEKLRLSEQLAESQRRYDETRRLADARRARIASTSHDLQQPLVSLRRSITAIGEPGSEERARAQAALDYLEGITDQGLAESAPDAQPEEAPDHGRESFPISIIVANCAAMFAREAEAGGIDLLGERSEAIVHADPVVLMRIASNLVSNAIKHSQGSHISIAARETEERVVLEVSDDGRGFTPEELADFSRAYAKGTDSSGHGLGLHLVKTACDEHGFGLEIDSRPGSGATFRVAIAKG